MPEARTFLLQLWQDEHGPWAVVKDEASGRLHQFESLETLIQFLSQGGTTMAQTEDPKPLEAQTLVRRLARFAELNPQGVG